MQRPPGEDTEVGGMPRDAKGCQGKSGATRNQKRLEKEWSIIDTLTSYFWLLELRKNIILLFCKSSWCLVICLHKSPRLLFATCRLWAP